MASSLHPPPRRVLVLGNFGVGKSTFTRALSARLRLPAYQMDYFFWLPGWELPEKNDWTTWIDSVLAQDEWILDGTYISSLSRRLLRADTVVMIDIPVCLSLYRHIRRCLFNPRPPGGENPVGCKDKISVRNLRAIISFHYRTRKKILDLISTHPRVFLFSTTKAAMSWVNVQNAP